MSIAREVFDKMMSQDYCSQWMGISPILIEEGHCKVQMTVRKEMLNGYSILHGGIAYAFADSAFAFAANSYGRLALSIHGSMSYASAAKEGDILIAEAKMLNLSHKTAEFDVNIFNADESEILYRFRGTVYRKETKVLSL